MRSERELLFDSNGYIITTITSLIMPRGGIMLNDKKMFKAKVVAPTRILTLRS